MVPKYPFHHGSFSSRNGTAGSGLFLGCEDSPVAEREVTIEPQELAEIDVGLPGVAPDDEHVLVVHVQPAEAFGQPVVESPRLQEGADGEFVRLPFAHAGSLRFPAACLEDTKGSRNKVRKSERFSAITP